MKADLQFAAILILVCAALFIYACGGSEDSTAGAGDAENVDDDSDADDDDSEDDDISECSDTITNVYNCGLYFFNDAGGTQTAENAYTECLALFETSDQWKCRINCVKGSTSCNMLYECLNLCPVDDTGSTDESE
jgi:hypothetical protein